MLLVTEVYAAGEIAQSRAPMGARSVASVRSRGVVEPVFVERVDDLAESLRGVLRDGDVVLTMGAGNIGAVAQESQEPHGWREARHDRRGVQQARVEAPHGGGRRVVIAAEYERARAIRRNRCPGIPRGMPAAPQTCFFTPRDVIDVSVVHAASCRLHVPT